MFPVHLKSLIEVFDFENSGPLRRDQVIVCLFPSPRGGLFLWDIFIPHFRPPVKGFLKIGKIIFPSPLF